MDIQPKHDSFQTVAQWHAWRLGLDLADYADVPLPGSFDTSGSVWNRFYHNLLSDLYTHSQAYGIPQAQFETYVPGDKVQENRVRESRLKVRKAIEEGYLDFLYQLGQAGDVDKQMLRVARPFFDQLVAEKTKKTKIKLFPQGLSRSGVVFHMSDDVIVTSPQYQGLFAGLSAFAKECVTIPEYGFYFFRRCDFHIFTGKDSPIFGDALRIAPESVQKDLSATDILLLEYKFKREIFVSDAGSGYRLRYSKKNRGIVYWCRVMNSFHSELDHNLRWEFDSEVTPMLFQELDAIKPDLSERVFGGIRKCLHCYEPCKARVIIKRNGQEFECCRDAGWEISGVRPPDFDGLRNVINVLVNLPSK
jgi:hypothetical protein